MKLLKTDLDRGVQNTRHCLFHNVMYAVSVTLYFKLQLACRNNVSKCVLVSAGKPQQLRAVLPGPAALTTNM